MIAIAEPSDEQISMEFQQLLPELVSRLRRRLFSTDPDLRDERTAEAVALAWATYVSARRRGRKPSVGNLSWYCGHSVLSGRRLAGATSLDALATTRTARERIGEHVSLSEIGENAQDFYRIFGDRRCRWPVVDIVGTKMDWQSFISCCDRRDQRIVEMKLDGYPQIEIAAELDVSPAFVCQRLRAVRQRWDSRAVA
ncbi:MAG: ECF-type sigma factor [Pirellulaceae bacterium]|nr:ECF-type sigma factor [Pirellulaceae bacterium]